jgi:hypothetical protein
MTAVLFDLILAALTAQPMTGDHVQFAVDTCIDRGLVAAVVLNPEGTAVAVFCST